MHLEARYGRSGYFQRLECNMRSPAFDAAVALSHVGRKVVQTPVPNVLPLDNVRKCRLLLPSSSKDAVRYLEAKGAAGPAGEPRAQARLPAHSKPQLPSVVDLMTEKLSSGPLSALVRLLRERAVVRVAVRHIDGLRGHCVGRLVALDKHWNMVLKDVTETYHELNVVHRELSASEAKQLPPGWDEFLSESRGVPFYVHRGSGSRQWERPAMRPTRRKRHKTRRHRRLGQILIRGDCVISVVRAPAA